ncbi:MAG: hypothetical protein COU07_03495 [Candidatus Harrisonbacteria bacterium CG10_big_fil_rev_8_21_14_0_10_40_38]|uniref:Zn-dependent hydrolase of the beta-lactamase fold-like protein n=1 Tax=Candidatus Harrisonbacteria bacterium CG10_big_fil_rev_8_21_14_0_10_40_38 TaxID=1974583 RepID=A0A2H0UT14_9BACT|nr:MAG: hypothetical protein COU07_03495 [Candidatus Harrisonbacteria bacterium CG10_big_fil_rev_8_21_14_0_10_40_38]
MVINWYGEGCFRIQSGDTTLKVDPFDSSTGLTPPRFKADLTIFTDTNYPLPDSASESEDGTIIVGPGEYEIKGIQVLGWQAEAEKEKIKSIYLVNFEDMRLGFLGNLKSIPKAEAVEELDGVDILFVPAGGESFASQASIGKLIKQISPKIIIPSFFSVPNLKRKADKISVFLDEIGKQDTKPQEKLTIKKKELSQSMQVIVLTV